MVHLPWQSLLHWQPFRIDALGLVTLLGAEEINASVGRLVRSTYLEFLPLLGAFVIAGDRFKEKEAGYKFYNITQGIQTPDLSAWLTRWMRAQEFEKQRSVVRWTIVPRSENSSSRLRGFWLSLVIGITFNGLLIALAVLSKDGWGIANAVSMLVSIYVRWYAIDENCKAIDHAISEAEKEAAKRAVKATEAETHREERQDAKVLVIMSDSKAITMTLPQRLIRSVFCATLDPLDPRRYHVVRWLGWIFFAVHILSIGMADLATQIYTVVLIVLPTILLVSKFGCDDSEWKPRIMSFLGMPLQHKQWIPNCEAGSPHAAPILKTCYIGSRLKAEVYEFPLSYDPSYKADVEGHDTGAKSTFERMERRQDLYAWLSLTFDEQKSMDKWDLFPHFRDGNHEWWQEYTNKAKNLAPTPGIALYETTIKLAIDDKRNPLHRDRPRRFSVVSCPADFLESPTGLGPAEVYGPTELMDQNPAFPTSAGQEVSAEVPQISIAHRAGTWPYFKPAVKAPRITIS